MELDIGIVGTWIAFALTLMVYCYLGKDIPFFHAVYRVAAYVFVGVALGYGAIMPGSSGGILCPWCCACSSSAGPDARAAWAM